MLATGSVVRLAGLASQPALNGAFGLVVKYEADKERYGIRLTVDGVSKVLALKRGNLIATADSSPSDSTGRLQQDALAARKAGARDLAVAFLNEYSSRAPSDHRAHTERSILLIALSRHEEAITAADMCIQLGHHADGYLRKAEALEKLGRKREAFDTLLLARDQSEELRANPGRVAPWLDRLGAEGARDGWMQHSQASEHQTTFRSTQPHCATCLKRTPPGRPSPDACCGRCGMVQYCCAAHCNSDAMHDAARCAILRCLAWRRLWEHCGVCVEILGTGGDLGRCDGRGFDVRVGLPPEAPPGVVQTPLLRESGFPSFSSKELTSMRGWAHFFGAKRVRRAWLSCVPPPTANDSDSLFGPQPPPSRGPPPPEVLSRHIGQELRGQLGALLTDAATAFYAIRELSASGKLDLTSLVSDGNGAGNGVGKGGGCEEGGAGGGSGNVLRIYVLGAEDREEGQRIQAFQNALTALVGGLVDGLLADGRAGAADSSPSTKPPQPAPSTKPLTNPAALANPPPPSSPATIDLSDVDATSSSLAATHAVAAHAVAAATGAPAVDSEQTPQPRQARVSGPVQVHAVHIGPGMKMADGMRAAAGRATGGGPASFRGSYTEYARDQSASLAHGSSVNALPPALLVAFHPGIYVNTHGYAWLETIELAIERNLPFIMTGLSEEDTRCTRELLEAIDADVLLDVPNPFASPLPTQTYPCENLTSTRNMRLFAFRGVRVNAAGVSLSATERRRRVKDAGRNIMQRLAANPLTT